MDANTSGLSQPPPCSSAQSAAGAFYGPARQLTLLDFGWTFGLDKCFYSQILSSISVDCDHCPLPDSIASLPTPSLTQGSWRWL